MIRDLRLALSSAFSWGSAIVLIFGCNLMQTKGLYDYIMYSISGSICLSIFAFIYHKHWIHPKTITNPIVKTFMVLLQVIILLFQMKLLYEFLTPFISSDWAYACSTMLGLVFVWWMYRKGLATSILTDTWQGLITMLSLVAAICYCVYIGCPTYDIITDKTPNWGWGIWSLITIPCAVLCDLQHWRRIELDYSKRCYYIATGVYLILFALIGGIAIFQIPNEVRLMMIIPVLGLATSTIDSIAVALHECYNKFAGTVVASLICCFWWAVMGESVLFLWNSMATVRLISAIVLFAVSFWYWKKYKQQH